MGERLIGRRQSLKCLGMLAGTVAGREFLAAWLPKSAAARELDALRRASYHAASNQPNETPYTPLFFDKDELSAVEALTEFDHSHRREPGSKRSPGRALHRFHCVGGSRIQSLLATPVDRGPAIARSSEPREVPELFSRDLGSGQREAARRNESSGTRRWPNSSGLRILSLGQGDDRGGLLHFASRSHRRTRIQRPQRSRRVSRVHSSGASDLNSAQTASHSPRQIIPEFQMPNRRSSWTPATDGSPNWRSRLARQAIDTDPGNPGRPSVSLAVWSDSGDAAGRSLGLLASRAADSELVPWLEKIAFRRSWANLPSCGSSGSFDLNGIRSDGEVELQVSPPLGKPVARRWVIVRAAAMSFSEFSTCRLRYTKDGALGWLVAAFRHLRRWFVTA